MDYHCTTCDMSFKTNKCLQQHLKCKRHADRMTNPSPIRKYECSSCGKKFPYRQSMHVHKTSCGVVPSENDAASIQEILRQKMDDMEHAFEKERREMKLAFEESIKERQEMKIVFEESMKEQINKILENHAGPTQNISNHIGTQNINININAFGNETTDYIDNKAILACIGRVYKSIPYLLEKLHFDPKHPENHNIKITNKKLPYASIMGNNQKWKTVDRKDAIEKMVLNGYNMLDEKYTENKDKVPASRQQNFEGFQTKFESEDKELMKQIKTEVDMLVLNGV
jgi:hypothetical protein